RPSPSRGVRAGDRPPGPPPPGGDAPRPRTDLRPHGGPSRPRRAGPGSALRGPAPPGLGTLPHSRGRPVSLWSGGPPGGRGDRGPGGQRRPGNAEGPGVTPLLDTPEANVFNALGPPEP